MEKNQPRLQEILFGSSEQEESNQRAALLKKGIIRKLAPRIYSTNLSDEPAAIIKRNWYHVVAHLYSGALLSHRTALESQPTRDGHIFLTTTYTKKVRLPGLTIHLLEGHQPLDGDNLFFKGLYMSQEARAYLENFQNTKTSTQVSKVLPLAQLEERLESIVRSRGEDGLNIIRDKARAMASELDMEKEFKKLNSIISALLTTGKSKGLTSPAAVARAIGEPLDPDRAQLFESLYQGLAGKVFPMFKDENVSDEAYKTFGFFEGYFSNYIEGTEFTVSEAKEIITTDMPMPSRDEDSHDILGTYQIVANRGEMSFTPTTANEFLALMRKRHAILLQSRISKKPGEFKDRNNRAGNTEFVDWQLTTGTLKKGFEWYSLLRDPFAKAVFMMFLVSEVHPFLDGNGRIARVMMNAELSKAGLSKIIIPTVFREDYMGALRKLTRQRTADAYVRMLLRAYEFSSTIIGENIDEMEQYLIECNAFKEPKEGKLIFKK